MATKLDEIEKRLWAIADDLRANSGLKASEYSEPVLGLIFLRFANERFKRVTAAIRAEMPEGYEITEDEKDRIKMTVRKLLDTLKKEKLRSDWNTKQAVKAQVRNAIKAALVEMPAPYIQRLNTLRDKIYEHVASTYDGTGKSIYDEVG